MKNDAQQIYKVICINKSVIHVLTHPFENEDNLVTHIANWAYSSALETENYQELCVHVLRNGIVEITECPQRTSQND